MYRECARCLQVYDIELILSWTPREYQAFIKGSQYREIDKLENLAISAMLHAKASSAKRMTVKKLFDADKARKRLDHNEQEKERDIERAMHLNDTFKGFKPQFRKKGGN